MATTEQRIDALETQVTELTAFVTELTKASIRLTDICTLLTDLSGDGQHLSIARDMAERLRSLDA